MRVSSNTVQGSRVLVSSRDEEAGEQKQRNDKGKEHDCS